MDQHHSRTEAPHERAAASGAPGAASDTGSKPPARRSGFAAMDAATRRQIASKGGKAAHEAGKAHTFTPGEARQAGAKGGRSVSRNRQHMAEIGRKGGKSVSQDREHMAEIGRKGGDAVSQEREHMAEIGGLARAGAAATGAGGPSASGPC
jgi:uncharacterized protein